MKNDHTRIDIDNITIVHPELSEERFLAAYRRIKNVLPRFRPGEAVGLADLDAFLISKYRAERTNWKAINLCTLTKVKRFNARCRTVFCVSEGHVADEEYILAYRIRHADCIRSHYNKDDYFYDMFVIVGSEDGRTLSSYFIGGDSEGFREEMFVLSGNR